MSWYSTSGLASPLFSPRRVSRLKMWPGLLDQGNTAGLQFSLAVDTTGLETPYLEETEVEELFSAIRLTRIRLRPEYNVLGFYLLLKGTFLQCLPDNYYIVKENELKILESVGIPYEIEPLLVESSAAI